MEKYTEICRRWEELDEVKDPVGMNSGLVEQNRRISELLLQKDAIIAECRKELMAADEHYYQDQAKQSEDLECLAERIDRHVETMKRAYHDQLEQLQRTIAEERVRIRRGCNEAWTELLDKKREQEVLKLTNQRKHMDCDDRELAALVLDHEELIRSTKCRLEADNECLQLELQKTKADVLLNTQKLDYNFEVLKRREEESVRNQQKKRLTRLHDSIADSRKTLKETDKKCAQEIRRLQTDICRLKGQISDLQQSSHATTRANDQKVRPEIHD